MTSFEMKKETLLEAAKVIKSFGYRAFVTLTDSGLMWGIYSNGKTVGYFQASWPGLISISTKHKPCRGCGTGINVVDEITPSEITAQILKEGLQICPNWYRDSTKEIVKYTPEEFFKMRGGVYTEI